MVLKYKYVVPMAAIMSYYPNDTTNVKVGEVAWMFVTQSRNNG